MNRNGQPLAAAAALILALGVVGLSAQRKPTVPAGKSPEAAKQLAPLLDAQKLTNFAAADPATPHRYVGVLYTPGVQIILIAGVFEGTDLDYYLYQRDYSSAFNGLRVLPGVKERLMFEDFGADGLTPQPAKNSVPDVVTIGSDKKTLDGDFSDPKVVNRSKISFDDYVKLFDDLDAKYVQAIGVLTAALKK